VGALDADVVVAAGVEVVRAHGWGGLSLRAVAAQLEVTPMALYRHVPDVAALTNEVIESISARMTEVPRSGDVREDLWAWAHAARSALSPFPGVAAHLLTVWFEVPSVLGTIEDLLDVAYDGGLDGFEAVAAVNALFMYVLMRAEAEQTVRTAGAVRRSLALAKSRRPLPRLRSLASYYTTAELDRHFEYGLQALLAGIGSRRSA
jgi:AcrR family transcriptional regulator